MILWFFVHLSDTTHLSPILFLYLPKHFYLFKWQLLWWDCDVYLLCWFPSSAHARIIIHSFSLVSIFAGVMEGNEIRNENETYNSNASGLKTFLWRPFSRISWTIEAWWSKHSQENDSCHLMTLFSDLCLSCLSKELNRNISHKTSKKNVPLPPYNQCQLDNVRHCNVFFRNHSMVWLRAKWLVTVSTQKCQQFRLFSLTHSLSLSFSPISLQKPTGWLCASNTTC